jgi:hypothetical protein
MGRSIFLSSILVVALTAVGCGASSKTSMVPTSNVSTTMAHMTPPPPPGEVEFSIVEDSSAKGRPPTTEHNAVSCKPNVQEKRGSLHAAY